MDRIRPVFCKTAPAVLGLEKAAPRIFLVSNRPSVFSLDMEMNQTGFLKQFVVLKNEVKLSFWTLLNSSDPGWF